MRRLPGCTSRVRAEARLMREPACVACLGTLPMTSTMVSPAAIWPMAGEEAEMRSTTTRPVNSDVLSLTSSSAPASLSTSTSTRSGSCSARPSSALPAATCGATAADSGAIVSATVCSYSLVCSRALATPSVTFCHAVAA
eukprot:scaffold42738_cov65-Phaeocystis_antarctica.AAC.2